MILCLWSDSLEFNDAILCLYWHGGIGRSQVNLHSLVTWSNGFIWSRWIVHSLRIRKLDYLGLVFMILCSWSDSLEFNGATACLYWNGGIGPRQWNCTVWKPEESASDGGSGSSTALESEGRTIWYCLSFSPGVTVWISIVPSSACNETKASDLHSLVTWDTGFRRNWWIIHRFRIRRRDRLGLLVLCPGVKVWITTVSPLLRIGTATGAYLEA